MRVIVGGVGYPDLCDYSAGVEVIERLAEWDAPESVAVEDLSYNPIAVVQRFEDQHPDDRFTRAIFVSAMRRGTRPPGTVSTYRWDGTLPSGDEIQRAVTDAVTGIIALENTLLIAQHFRALPAEVIVIEVEPELHAFGATLTSAVATALPDVCELVKTLATDRESITRLPVRPLEPAASPATSAQ